MITLTHEILPNGDLKISTDAAGREELQQRRQEAPDTFGTDVQLYDAFEYLIANSELDWVLPETIGALTSAPILGIYGDPIIAPNGGVGMDGRLVGSWYDPLGVLRDWVEPVQKAWGYMAYQLRSPLDDLLDAGYCIFQTGE